MNTLEQATVRLLGKRAAVLTEILPSAAVFLLLRLLSRFAWGNSELFRRFMLNKDQDEIGAVFLTMVGLVVLIFGHASIMKLVEKRFVQPKTHRFLKEHGMSHLPRSVPSALDQLLPKKGKPYFFVAGSIIGGSVLMWRIGTKMSLVDLSLPLLYLLSLFCWIQTASACVIAVATLDQSTGPSQVIQLPIGKTDHPVDPALVQPLTMLIRHIADSWEFNSDQYPALAECTDELARSRFVFTHIMRHVHKAVGAIEGDMEQAEHQRTDIAITINPVLLAKLLVEILRLAELRGVGSKRLLVDVERVLADQV